MRLSITPALVLVAIPRGALGQYATADMMRFQCSRLVVERVDPLANPGLLQSTHIHQIVGGNSFNATMTPVDYDPSRESTCTTCDYSEDFFNYWTANLYFRARNGTYKRVKQMVNLVRTYPCTPYTCSGRTGSYSPNSSCRARKG